MEVGKLINPASFRDPNGFIFSHNDVIYRQINTCYKENYDHLLQSGLYEALVVQGLLIEHEEVSLEIALTDEAYQVLKPRAVPFISYPYEWSFSQLKDAALTTLKIQKRAFAHGMTLKDASAYNIQFLDGRPVLIDTLSFETYPQNSPWVAYRQFCQHFLAPLALMACKDNRLGQLLRIYIDGLPLDLADNLLPLTSIIRPYLFIHIHLHAKSQRHFANQKVAGNFKMKPASFLGLMDSLESAINGLKWKLKDSEWIAYYQADTNYSPEGFQHKKDLVSSFLKQCKPKTVWDLGANTGEFSRLAIQEGALTISWDMDLSCVETNYRTCREKGEKQILPLFVDLTNPSSAIGWAHQERKSLIERGPADMVLSLGLMHHLTISNNVPFNLLANFFSKICKHLLIEFVPKSDSQIQRLLRTREDIFLNYTKENFEKEFGSYFRIIDCAPIKDSQRILYHMEKRLWL